MPQEYGEVTAQPSAAPAQPTVAAVLSGSLASAAYYESPSFREKTEPLRWLAIATTSAKVVSAMV
jgi:hypothetical protein